MTCLGVCVQKQEIHGHFVQQLTHELETITTAARATISTATDEAHHAEGKYDTFSLETSYLARGQARRVEELRNTLERLGQMPVKVLGAQDPIQLSALVRLQSASGEKRTVYFGAAGGGESLRVNGEDILIVTSQSPLGRAMLGKIKGESFALHMAGETQKFTVLSVG